MQKEILNSFLYNHNLKFSDLEKITKIRSNKLAYHVKRLEKNKIIEKNGNFYKLSEDSETLIPYITDKNSVISVILVAIRKSEKIFLIKRNKRPFDDKLCMPGGRIVVGETIKQATERIMKEKFNIKSKFEKVNSISLEHVKKKGRIIHSFLLVFVSATSKEELDYIDIKKKKNKIISSDYYLIKNEINKKTDIKNLVTNQKSA